MRTFSAAVLVLAVPVAFLAFKSASGGGDDDDDEEDDTKFQVPRHPSPFPHSGVRPCLRVAHGKSEASGVCYGLHAKRAVCGTGAAAPTEPLALLRLTPPPVTLPGAQGEEHDGGGPCHAEDRRAHDAGRPGRLRDTQPVGSHGWLQTTSRMNATPEQFSYHIHCTDRDPVVVLLLSCGCGSRRFLRVEETRTRSSFDSCIGRYSTRHSVLHTSSSQQLTAGHPARLRESAPKRPLTTGGLS